MKTKSFYMKLHCTFTCSSLQVEINLILLRLSSLEDAVASELDDALISYNHILQIYIIQHSVSQTFSSCNSLL